MRSGSLRQAYKLCSQTLSQGLCNQAASAILSCMPVLVMKMVCLKSAVDQVFLIITEFSVVPVLQTD